MKRDNKLFIFVLLIAGLFFIAVGCVKVVKQEDIKKAAEPSPVVKAQEEKASAAQKEATAVKDEKVVEQLPAAKPQEEKASAAKKETAAKKEAAAVKEEKVVEQPIREAPVSETTAKLVPESLNHGAEKEVSAKAEAGDETTELARKQGMLLTVYFDFDRFTIRDDMKTVMEKNAEWLKKNNGIKIQIQGHADERGTNEYNIAIGERRAQVIKQYLADSGVDKAKLSTISYGEERPADPGHTEEAWAKNRRVEIVVIK